MRRQMVCKWLGKLPRIWKKLNTKSCADPLETDSPGKNPEKANVSVRGQTAGGGACGGPKNASQSRENPAVETPECVAYHQRSLRSPLGRVFLEEGDPACGEALAEYTEIGRLERSVIERRILTKR